MKKEYSIIFDMDGTLVDSSLALTHSVNYVRDTLGLEPIDQRALEYYINQPNQRLPLILYNTPEYQKEHIALFCQHYIKNSAQYVTLYDGVEEMLSFLSQRAWLGVATNASDFLARHVLEHLQIDHYFDAIVGSNNVSEPKPSPQMLHLVMQNLSSQQDKTFLVGDSSKDELAAHHAKIAFIFAKWGYGKSESATINVSDIEALMRFLKTFI